MFDLKEKSGGVVRVTANEWNQLIRAVKRLAMVRGGAGIRVANMPTGLTFSLDKRVAGIGGTEFQLAKILSQGPNNEVDFTLAGTGAMYWVREVAIVSYGASDQPDFVHYDFNFPAGGFWESALNVAEVGLPWDCQHYLVKPMLNALDYDSLLAGEHIPKEVALDETLEWNRVVPLETKITFTTPIVATWIGMTRRPDGTDEAFRMFSMPFGQIVEEYILQTFGVDADGCPDVYEWRKRVSVLLRETQWEVTPP